MDATTITCFTVVATALALIIWQVFTLRKVILSKEEKQPLDEKEKKAAQAFFKRVINVRGSKYRTTTLNALIIAAKTNYDDARRALNFPNDRKSARFNDTGNSPQAVLDANKYYDVDSINTINISNNEGRYEAYIIRELGLSLGTECPCPGGGYCDWEVKMLENIIVDASFINLSSIEIFIGDSPVPISTSSFNFNQGFGNYILIEMNNLEALREISTCTTLRVVVKWNFVGSDKIHCIALCNRIFCEEPQRSFSQNGTKELATAEQS